MFEWIASNFGPGAAIAAVILCATGGIAVAIQTSRRVSRSKVPWLLRFGMFVALLAGSICFPLCVAGLFGFIEVQGELSRRGELTVLGSCAIVFAVLGASSLGYYFDRPWSRHLAVAFWPVVWVCLLIQSRWVPGFGAGELIVVTGETLVFAIAVVLYFYRKQTVISYYRGIERAA